MLDFTFGFLVGVATMLWIAILAARHLAKKTKSRFTPKERAQVLVQAWRLDNPTAYDLPQSEIDDLVDKLQELIK